MLFHTWTFAAFFLVVYPVYLLVRGARFRNHWLLAASYVFYGWWNPLYLLLIAATTTFDYFLVIWMERSRWKTPWMTLSLASNLGLLAFFKYAGFLTRNLNALLGPLGVPALPQPDILLPVGISFFTFQSLSYTLDAYRGGIRTERSLVRFATFVSFFPQLVAGPVERARNLLPQLYGRRRIAAADVAEGLSHFLAGLFKKVALADALALYADKVYAAPGDFEAPALACATIAFGWQIYFDFSGYTDMARGAARLMGFRLMLNFNHPYVATGLGEFWNRWHISLSSWFRDYVYIPLGGNRGGTAATYRNMFLTMVLSGLWHGAAWTFLIWGALHAAGRVVTRELERTAFWVRHVPRLTKQALVFGFVSFAWIFFRAASLPDAWLIVTRLANWRWADPGFPLILGGWLTAVWLYQELQDRGGRTRELLDRPAARIAAAVAMIVWLAVAAQPASRPFIYFQF